MFDETGATQRKGTSGETGTGFGMPLVRRVVEASGGEIRAHSPALPAAEHAAADADREPEAGAAGRPGAEGGASPDGGPGTTIELRLTRVTAAEA
jgi:signal transduction histidine kinase